MPPGVRMDRYETVCLSRWVGERPMPVVYLLTLPVYKSETEKKKQATGSATGGWAACAAISFSMLSLEPISYLFYISIFYLSFTDAAPGRSHQGHRVNFPGPKRRVGCHPGVWLLFRGPANTGWRVIAALSDSTGSVLQHPHLIIGKVE